MCAVGECVFGVGECTLCVCNCALGVSECIVGVFCRLFACFGNKVLQLMSCYKVCVYQ